MLQPPGTPSTCPQGRVCSQRPCQGTFVQVMENSFSFPQAGASRVVDLAMATRTRMKKRKQEDRPVCGARVKKPKGNEGLARRPVKMSRWRAKMRESWAAPGQNHQENGLFVNSPGSSAHCHGNLDKPLLLREPQVLIYKRRIAKVSKL